MTERATNLRGQSLHARAESAGQGHLLQQLDALSGSERTALEAELAALDWSLIESFRRQLGSASAEHAAEGAAIAPPDTFPRRRTDREEQQARAASRTGEELLRQGRVGYVLVAGGQASRLGYDGPKGAFRIAPVSDRTLFELHARRLLAVRDRYRVAVPWYVMTSPANDRATREFFAESRWFGLDRGDVFFFAQAMVPALDPAGRILMASRSSLFLSPNGHGGVLLALETSGAIADMRARGIEQLSYLQVDNPLAPPADPLFIGLHLEAGAGMSSKVVDKRNAAEKVGVLGLVDDRTRCIEYSDLPTELREARGAHGELLYRAGNIAMHVLEVGFVESLTRAGLKLPWHVARKKVSVWSDGREATVVGAKFETFVFDALPLSPASVTLEVAREEEFSPVKNATGEDSPASCRADMCRLHAGWVAAAGLQLPPPGEHGVAPVEIDPWLADRREVFLALGPIEAQKSERGHLYTQ